MIEAEAVHHRPMCRAAGFYTPSERMRPAKGAALAGIRSGGGWAGRVNHMESKVAYGNCPGLRWFCLYRGRRAAPLFPLNPASAREPAKGAVLAGTPC
jgi:hypothetical protein